MELELQIDGGKYPVEIQMIVEMDGKVTYRSEYKGATISTFHNYKGYSADSLEESIALIAKDLRKAIQELLEQ
jgi:hypothetical protein